MGRRHARQRTAGLAPALRSIDAALAGLPLARYAVRSAARLNYGDPEGWHSEMGAALDLVSAARGLSRRDFDPWVGGGRGRGRPLADLLPRFDGQGYPALDRRLARAAACYNCGAAADFYRELGAALDEAARVARLPSAEVSRLVTPPLVWLTRHAPVPAN